MARKRKFSPMKLILDQIRRHILELQRIQLSIMKKRKATTLIKARQTYITLLTALRKSRAIFNKFLRKFEYDTQFQFKVRNPRLPFVLSFFADLYSVLERLFQVLDYDRRCCIVIGNRTVKNVIILTDQIIIELARNLGFEHDTTFYRKIPSKRIPQMSAPSNIPGDNTPTITKESIIILQKPQEHQKSR